MVCPSSHPFCRIVHRIMIWSIIIEMLKFYLFMTFFEVSCWVFFNFFCNPAGLYFFLLLSGVWWWNLRHFQINASKLIEEGNLNEGGLVGSKNMFRHLERQVSIFIQPVKATCLSIPRMSWEEAFLIFGIKWRSILLSLNWEDRRCRVGFVAGVLRIREV